MLTFVIGASGTGKSTFAADLAQRTRGHVVSAGRWVREAAGPNPDMGTLEATALARLRQDPYFAAKWIEERLKPYDHEGIVEGIRNPTDLLYLARPGDHVVDLGGAGRYHWEREGLKAVRACRGHLIRLGVSWAEHTRAFARLPVPLPAFVEARLLYQDDRPDLEAGTIVALESYEGKPVTALWRSAAGGTFHDLPLDGFILATKDGLDPADALEMRRQPAGDPLHGIPAAPWPAGQGSPVIEQPPFCLDELAVGLVSVFRPDRTWAGTGRLLWTIHWPDGNELFHLIEVAQGLRLWPPHKLSLNPNTRVLPEWKKRRV